MTDKFSLQDEQYRFPYHHIPHIDHRGRGVRHRVLTWGLEYLCYQLHVAQLIQQRSPDSVLEVGCGDGFLTGRLASIAERCVGVDLSEQAIAFAKAFHPNVEFRTIDAAQLNQVFDVVTAVEVMEHIPDDELDGFLNTLYQRTKVGGQIILSVPTTVRPLQDKHFRHYDLPLLEAQIHSSGVDVNISQVDYIYHEDALFRAYRRLTNNKLWYLDLRPLRDLIWQHVWTRLRYATAATGHHLVVVLEKAA